MVAQTEEIKQTNKNERENIQLKQRVSNEAI